MKRNIFIILALLITTIISNAQTTQTNEIVYELDNVKVVNKNGLAVKDFISLWKSDPNIVLIDVRTTRRDKANRNYQRCY